jgi:hypothetical protein
MCLKCAADGKGKIYLSLQPVDERLSKRMVDNVGYPAATRTGLQLKSVAREQFEDESPAAAVRGWDVYAIDKLPGLYVRVTEATVGVAGSVRAVTEGYRLWKFVRWPESIELLDATERLLDCIAQAVAESIADETSPEYKGKKEDPLSSGEEA